MYTIFSNSISTLGEKYQKILSKGYIDASILKQDTIM